MVKYNPLFEALFIDDKKNLKESVSVSDSYHIGHEACDSLADYLVENIKCLDYADKFMGDSIVLQYTEEGSKGTSTLYEITIKPSHFEEDGAAYSLTRSLMDSEGDIIDEIELLQPDTSITTFYVGGNIDGVRKQIGSASKWVVK